MTPSRRFVLIAASISAFATLAAAPPEKSVPVGKAFPYLENYLKMPASERSRFTLGYFLTIGGKPATDVKVWLVDGNKRTPIPIGAEGAVLRTPNLGELERNTMVVVGASPDTKFGLQLVMEPLVPRGAEMDAQALALSAVQADAGVRKAAGVLGFAAPKLTRIYFKGGTGGEAVFADGHAVKLGVLKGFAFYDIEAESGAKTIRFAKAPTIVMIGPAAH
jgi:hypothetical protein